MSATLIVDGANTPITVYSDDPTFVLPGEVIAQCAKTFRLHAPCPDGRVAQIVTDVISAFLRHPDSRYASGLHEQIEAQADELSTLASCVEELRAEHERLSVLKNHLALDNQSLNIAVNMARVRIEELKAEYRAVCEAEGCGWPSEYNPS